MAGLFYLWLFLGFLFLRFVDPPTTALQFQRRTESWFAKGPYTKRYNPVDLEKISTHLQHAVIAAEDGRFYNHGGFDWVEIKDAVFDDLEDGRIRGASTISQQLVKNLFLTTRGSFVRKGLEFAIVPVAEFVLGKQRILELYLNVIEWGPGVYGAEAAAQYHFKIHASQLNREQAARLASVLPSPRRRSPQRATAYSAKVLQRMSEHGW
jgi:monofunctional biosynthetic peptidoglycan transglycosylase